MRKERNNRNTVIRFFRLIFVLCNDCDLESILKEQYFLARGSNITITDSNLMPEFERKIIFGMLLKDLKEESNAYKQK